MFDLVLGAASALDGPASVAQCLTVIHPAPASAYPGPSTPERSSPRSTRSFGSVAAQDARRVVPELAAELRQMQAWLELDRIEIAERGDLAAKLRRSVRYARPRWA